MPDLRAAAVIAVTDLERARDFYEGKLGLTGSATPGGWTIEAGHDTVLHLLPDVSTAGSADWPVATFLVSDVRATVREFRSRGVPFLGPDDLPFALDDDGVSDGQSGMKVAWMRDPDGSVLTVYELEAADPV
jgi:catechol 2,3-dioxygenase-like lactoylglutathione lyase family enzyme